MKKELILEKLKDDAEYYGDNLSSVNIIINV